MRMIRYRQSKIYLPLKNRHPVADDCPTAVGRERLKHLRLPQRGKELFEDLKTIDSYEVGKN